MSERQSIDLYKRLQQQGDSKRVLATAFMWGVAEGTLFFIVPDLYLALVALFHWRAGLWAVGINIVGSLVGGALMYGLAVYDGAAMAALLTHIPLISPAMLETVAQLIKSKGLPALIGGPLGGIPYKVYAVQAGRLRLAFVPFLLMTILARLVRILPATLGGAVSGVLLTDFIQRRTRLALGIYTLIWVGVYTIYYFQAG